MAVRLWRAVGSKPVDGKDSIDAAAPKQNVGLLKNEDVSKWTPTAEQSVQDDREPAPPPTEPEIPEVQTQVVTDDASSPMNVLRKEGNPAIREREPELAPEPKKVDDERTIANVSPIKTDIIASDESSFVDKNGPWGSVSEERAHLDDCMNKRVQCGGKLRQLYG